MIQKLIIKIDVNVKAMKNETNCTFLITMNMKNYR